ncbi:MAG: 4'-phosphopantetheinyl transferase superfamily protein [Clostridia bacterium]|nr:4'-phosphopantetheinyl transferase superfamily protein [Clostridia bacterium]
MVFGVNGKGTLSNSPLNYGVSHSGGVVAVAVGDIPVGIDVQVVDSKKLSFLRTYFSKLANEINYETMPVSDQIQLLTKQWCVVESYSKCFGGAVGSLMRLRGVDMNKRLQQEELICSQSTINLYGRTYCIAVVCATACTIERLY